MTDLSAVYEELLASDEGDILVKLKNGNQLKIISFLIKKRSPVFKTMMESSMKEVATGVVDLSSQYSLEAFREFMAYIYYNKLYTGSYVQLLFEILCIADYYEVDPYRTYIRNRIIELITNVPICLVIASEALKHGSLTDRVYASCVGFLMEAIKPQGPECYDEHSGDTVAWCCSSHSRKIKRNCGSQVYTVNGQVACIYSTLRGYPVDSILGYTQRCCIHRPSKQALVDIKELPDFIVDDINSAKIDDQEEQESVWME